MKTDARTTFACENDLTKMRAVYLGEIFQSWDIFQIFTRTQELRLLSDVDSCVLIWHNADLINNCTLSYNRGSSVGLMWNWLVFVFIIIIFILFHKYPSLLCLKKRRFFTSFHGYVEEVGTEGKMWKELISAKSQKFETIQ